MLIGILGCNFSLAAEIPFELAKERGVIIPGESVVNAQKILREEIHAVAKKEGLNPIEMPDGFSQVIVESFGEYGLLVVIYGESDRKMIMSLTRKIIMMIENSNVRLIRVEYHKGVEKDNSGNDMGFVSTGALGEMVFEVD